MSLNCNLLCFSSLHFANRSGGCRAGEVSNMKALREMIAVVETDDLVGAPA